MNLPKPLLKFQIVKNSKYPVFDTKRQMRLVETNQVLIQRMLSSKNISEWNKNRESIIVGFNNLTNEDKGLLKIMFLGYIDSTLTKPFKA